ncbi:MAG: efflux RND transporter permease subunit [Proteobacteria bacterium]|nr:efflux RND transporter permease subunit [Pseudomonadota bacterium]MBI3497559.1 efflux RND transporter permease subunit [Pseudomonadota bacterium]
MSPAGWNISGPFIRRPVATILLMLGVLILGGVAYTRLPIAALPSVDRPTIGLWASLPGASADTVATALAQPLETQLGIIPGIVEMSSFSAMGGTSIVLQFDLRKDIDAAAGEVQAAINAAGPNLPKAWAWPPVYWKANPAGAPVIALALSSDVIPPGEIYQDADSVIGPKISQLPGVARLWITGAERSAVRVQVSAGRLAAMNLSLDAVRAAIVASTQNLPKGAIDDGAQRYMIEANDQLLKAVEYQDVIVAWRNGAPIRLGDIATVTDSVINNKVAGWFGTGRSVVIYVAKQPDANIVETVDAIKAALPEIKRWLPASVKVQAVYDRTTLIRASIADVQRTIAIATALVVLVIALFLRRFWATVISSLAIPISLAATLVVMALSGFTLDNLSLMAITIAVGFVIDDAVIMIEIVAKRIDEGQSPVEAAFAGTRQLGFTVVSITAALVAALIPVLFMPDVVGRYFREFGVTLVAAIVASALVSLSLTPMMCARLLARRKPPAAKAQRRIRLQGWFTRAYERSLDWALRHRWISLALTLAVTAATVWLYIALPKGFMPQQDTGIMFLRTIANANVSFPDMEDRQRRAGEAILKDPAVSGILSYVGEGGGDPVSFGSMLIALKPPEERRIPIQDVIKRLRDFQLPTFSAGAEGSHKFLRCWNRL